jgi:hypothetical protein
LLNTFLNLNVEILPIICLYIGFGVAYMALGETTYKIFNKTEVSLIKDWYKVITYWDVIMLILFLPISILVFILFFILYLLKILHNLTNIKIYRGK